MRKSLKSILFFFLPVFCLIFFQMEKGRMGIDKHKSGYVADQDQSDISPDVIDDSVTILACDDDDDSSESIARIVPLATIISCPSPVFHSETSASFPPSRNISYRDISPSFLKVFRI
jgi:hypothetical protein